MIMPTWSIVTTIKVERLSYLYPLFFSRQYKTALSPKLQWILMTDMF